MFLNPANFRQGHTERATVCVIGSGPAGLTLAQDLVGAGIDVIVVEAGGDGYSPESQEHYAGEVRGDDYFDLRDARLRMLGGTSGHWGGICRPLPRATINSPHPNGATGWPITYTDLQAHEVAAARVVEIEPSFSDIDMGGGLWQLDFRQSPAIQFGEKYRDLLETNPNVRVALETVLVDFEYEDTRIIAARLVSGRNRQDFRHWRIEADYFALCAGGIENSRLLAWINERNGRRLIINHDLIGRYWMEHPYCVSAHAIVFDSRLKDRLRQRIYLGTESLDQEDYPHSRANFEWHPLRANESRGLLRDLLCIAPRLGNRLVNAAGRDLVCGGTFGTHSEQPPQVENRVALGRETDIFGVPRPVLHWARSAIDRQIIVEATERLAEAFAATNYGRVMLSHWTLRDNRPISDATRTAGYHQMGGTRMSRRPEDGIVDANLKVHDLENLFVGGSSVFPTGGDANPTFTIVQLSLRLASFIKTLIHGGHSR